MNWVLPLISVAVFLLLIAPRLRRSRSWRATITPLASIIGSGFLVVAPVLGHLLGIYAFFGMLLITLVAIEVGEVLRFNISHAEPLMARGMLSPVAEWTERAADLSLSLAYVISVAFYLRLMAAFALHGPGLAHAPYPDLLTTVILAGIGMVGWRWGLRALENLEEYSVSIKLSVIAALLIGLGAHDYQAGFDLSQVPPVTHQPWDMARILAGLLLVVQGFETSRYLGDDYAPEMRIRSMRRAQWLSTAIYLAFILLVTPFMGIVKGNGPVHETAVIDMAATAAYVLGPMLILAAVMSQFSAAIADTLGAGGLVEEESGRRITSRRAYLAITALAIMLVWSANLFEIISLASRAFALYYLLQTLLALQLTGDLERCRGRLFCRLRFAAIAAVLVFVVVFGKPLA